MGSSSRKTGKTVATDHAAAARELVGTGIWVVPVDLSLESDEIKASLVKQVLTEAENAMLSERFNLSREELLKMIALAGRMPHVAGGGALDTYCIEAATAYPAFRTIDPVESREVELLN